MRRGQKSPTPRKRPQSGTYPTFLNKSHTGRHTAKHAREKPLHRKYRKRVAALFFSGLRFWLFFRMQRFHHQPYSQSKAGDKAFAFVQTIQLCHCVFEFSEQLDLVFIHRCFERCVMSENQFSELVTLAVFGNMAVQKLKSVYDSRKHYKIRHFFQ